MKNKITKTVSLLLAVCMVFAIAGCSSANQPQNAAPSSSPDQESSTTAKPGKKLVIASLVQPMDNPWVVNYVNFQKLVADALGIELIVTADKGTEDSHIQAMQALIARNPDGIVFDPITKAAGSRDASLIEQFKIPSITSDRLVVNNYEEYKGQYLIGQPTFSNFGWGYGMMKALIDQGSTNVAAILDPKGVLTVEEAWVGAKKALEENPNVKLVAEEWQPKSRENAINTTQRYLTKFGPGQLDGIMAFGSSVGLGSLYAVEQAGRTDVKISTSDDDKDVINTILNGKLSSTLGAHWLIGGFSLIMLYDKLNGHDSLERQPRFELFKIDKGNAEAYSKRFLEGAPFTAEEIKSFSQVYNKDAKLPEIMKTLVNTWNQKK